MDSTAGGQELKQDPALDTGQEVLHWLRQQQLKIDPTWLEEVPDGFRWWADLYAQSFTVTAREPDEAGELHHHISVQTDVLRGVRLEPAGLAAVNDMGAMASMSGLVHDEKARTLRLCATAAVNDRNRAWMQKLLGLAAVLQLHDANLIAKQLQPAVGGALATSTNPGQGLRPYPDAMSGVAVQVIEPAGKYPSRWSAQEMAALVERTRELPFDAGAQFTDGTVSVRLPAGDTACLCELHSTVPHATLGNGLFVTQSFAAGLPEHEGQQWALALNARELGGRALGYGFGSYCYLEQMLHFISFYPNVAHTPGVAWNILMSLAERASALAEEIGSLAAADA